MITLSELRIAEDAFFGARLNYYKPSLYPLIEDAFSENSLYGEETERKMESVLAAGNRKRAHLMLLKKDFQALGKQMEKLPKEFDENIWRDMLPRIREEVRGVLGLDFKPRGLFFQDRFPEGLLAFEKKGASSVTVFEGQRDAGIYFLNKRVSSFFTPILLIHEQLHSCMSQNKSKEQMYIEWFEEGLCMWYSMLIYHKITKNIDVIKLYRERSYIYSKVKPEFNFSKRYYEYMKIFSRLFLAGGPKLIGKMMLAYMSNQRKEINSYLKKSLPIAYVPQSPIEQELTQFAIEVEPEKVTPLEYLVMTAAKNPIFLEDLQKKTKAPDEVLAKVLMRMQIKGLVIMKEAKLEVNWRKLDLLEGGLLKPVYPA